MSRPRLEVSQYKVPSRSGQPPLPLRTVLSYKKREGKGVVNEIILCCVSTLSVSTKVKCFGSLSTATYRAELPPSPSQISPGHIHCSPSRPAYTSHDTAGPGQVPGEVPEVPGPDPV